jgi:hypothetical protein
MHYFSTLFWYRILHVSDRFIVYHQESNTVYTVIGILILIYLLTAIGLSPGGSSTVHFYTKKYIERYKTNIT